MIDKRRCWILWPCVVLLMGATLVVSAFLGLLRLPLREWFGFWEEPHTLLAVLLGPPVFVLLVVILALLAKEGESDRHSAGEVDHLLSLKRRGLLHRGLQWTRTIITRSGFCTESTRPMAEVNEAHAEEPGAVLDRLVRRKRQGALSPYHTNSMPAESLAFWSRDA